MVRILGPDGNPVDPKMLLSEWQVGNEILDPQAEALYERTKDEPITVIVPAMVAALFVIQPLMSRVVRHHPEMIGRYQYAPMQPRGGGDQHERRTILGGLNHSITGKAVVVVDPICETGDSYRELLEHPSVNNQGATWIKPLFLVVKSHFLNPATPPSIGQPYDFPGTDFLIGGLIGLDLDQFFRELPYLATVPFGSRVDPRSIVTHAMA